MNKNSLIGITIALLVVSSVVLTHFWWNCKKDNERLLKDIYTDSFHSRLVLSDMPGYIEYSLKNNISDSYLRLQLIRYAEHAWILEKMFYEIYAHTGDGRYYLLGSAMSNVADFLGDVANDSPKKMRSRLQEKIGVLKELGKSLKELTKYQTPESIPHNLAEELFNLSERLW